ncbi:TIGR03663 family protein [Thermanaerothrix sp. 4228-RoL]|uniref:TIGR03663 family protein n=2 Tax=Thermanaerothrix TaxID=1077886 RepID=A0ABU3NJA9_9CHLR|nr:flippase activity-associated protein Agl23 [Thermanaerothrix sp. 4228-RoL]MDT8896892.1 TIGR03663 family protein [Thermanaerothrix sp. 4228-RoL]
MNAQPTDNVHWLDRPVWKAFPKIRWETLLIIVILGLALFTRFYHLGDRVMSHDEVNHVVPSWELYMGRGYRHDPITHGPFQFHVVALSYFLFGDNDFTSRIPAALFSVATIMTVILGFRRYLGRNGAIIAGVLFLISPYMLFYGRYTRNEAFVAFWGGVTLLAVLKYLEAGERRWLYILTVVTALQFATKETAFIYTAQLLLFLAILFMLRSVRFPWPEARKHFLFNLALAGALFVLVLAIVLAGWNAIANRSGVPAEAGGVNPLQIIEAGLAVVAVVLGGMAGVILLREVGWEFLKQERSLDMLLLIGTLILPQLTAFPVKIFGVLLGQNWNPLDYSSVGILRSGIVLLILTLVALSIGLVWKPRLWLTNFVLFYGIFTVLYTTVFTNGFGFFTGIVGSLGYWLEQQGVNRGTQPWYYYAFLQIPMYEYVAALGTLLAIYFGWRYHRFSQLPGDSPITIEVPFTENPQLTLDVNQVPKVSEDVEKVEFTKPPVEERLPVLGLLVFWGITSLGAYSLAGEKMPWLTVHIALPLLLSAGWGLGALVDRIPWSLLKQSSAWVGLLLIPVFLSAIVGALMAWLGPVVPFSGYTLEYLQVTTTFLFASVTALLSGWGIFYVFRGWRKVDWIKLIVFYTFGFLGVLTFRTAATAAYINYDTAKEFLVYAHAASGPKEILAQVEEISRRLTRGLDIQVAYDNDALYPYWWYFRDYPNKRYFADNPTRDLRDVPIIIAGNSANWSKLDAITKGEFVQFEYMRLWWPMQDYYNLTWDRIWGAIRDPKMRAAVFQIWLNRDYTAYAQLTGNQNLTLEKWEPSAKLRFYVRKDVVAQMWNYGVLPEQVPTVEVDPYQKGMVQLTPDLVIGQVGLAGNQPGQFQNPRGIAIAPDGSIYVADSRNHRIQHLSARGEVLQVWGSFADSSTGEAPGGTFNEPWGVAVGPDGSVYVADTWNHRIQKFTSDGQFVTMWGYFGQAERPDAFWGPRDVAVDAQGRVYVTDTGNKRVVIFTSEGQYIAQFGGAGVEAGKFDEPVGIDVDTEGNIYIADTWNQRVQVITPDFSNNLFIPVREWEISGWYGQSLDNKPFISISPLGHVFVTDPEGYRVLEFDAQGNFVRGWGDYSTGTDGFGLPSGIAVDSQGRVWVSDAGNHVLLRFVLP